MLLLRLDFQRSVVFPATHKCVSLLRVQFIQYKLDYHVIYVLSDLFPRIWNIHTRVFGVLASRIRRQIKKGLIFRRVPISNRWQSYRNKFFETALLAALLNNMNEHGMSCGVQYAISIFVIVVRSSCRLVVYFFQSTTLNGMTISKKLRVGNAKRFAKTCQKQFERAIEQRADRITDIGKSVFYCHQCTNDIDIRRERE